MPRRRIWRPISARRFQIDGKAGFLQRRGLDEAAGIDVDRGQRLGGLDVIQPPDGKATRGCDRRAISSSRP